MTAPQSPIGDDNDNEVATPLALGSRNPFLASIIASTRTPLTGRDLTGSGTHLKKSTEQSSVRSGSKPGSSDEPTSRPEPAGTIQEHARTWNISSPRTGGRLFTLGTLPTGNSWPESTLTAIGTFTRPIQDTDAPTYEHERRRKSPSSEGSSKSSPSDSTSDSGKRITRTDFQYDWASAYLGYNLEEAGWGNPRPMADSPPNP